MYTIDWKHLNTGGGLDGLMANEARYFATKYQRPFLLYTAEERSHIVAYVKCILADRQLHLCRFVKHM